MDGPFCFNLMTQLSKTTSAKSGYILINSRIGVSGTTSPCKSYPGWVVLMAFFQSLCSKIVLTQFLHISHNNEFNWELFLLNSGSKMYVSRYFWFWKFYTGNLSELFNFKKSRIFLSVPLYMIFLLEYFYWIRISLGATDVETVPKQSEIIIWLSCNCVAKSNLKNRPEQVLILDRKSV